MESARSGILRSCVVIGIAFLVGYLVANPAGTVWRARYWLSFGDRTEMLQKLVEVEPVGAESELDHALESDDQQLRFAAASELAARGDKRGLEALVAMCGKGTGEGSPSRRRLEELLENPEHIDRFDSVREWFDSTRHILECRHDARWTEGRGKG
jgi:hypothetical protein